MLFVAVGTSQGVEAVNYIFDSLLFAGSVLLLAAGMPSGSNQSAPARPVGALKLRRRAGAGLGT